MRLLPAAGGLGFLDADPLKRASDAIGTALAEVLARNVGFETVPINSSGTVMMRGRSKERAAGRFERYSDDLRREFEKLLGPHGLEALENFGQLYTNKLDSKDRISTPRARAKDLDKKLSILASVRKELVDSGFVVTGGEGLFQGNTVGMTVEDKSATVKRLKETAAPEIESVIDAVITYRGLVPSEVKTQIIDRLQAQIDLHETWVRVLDDTESQLTRLRRNLDNSPSRSSMNRDQSMRDQYFANVFALWCTASRMAPPVKGRWKERGAAIAFLTKAAGPVVGNLRETAIRNWLANHVARLRRRPMPDGI
jgi:hypothetical protein